MSPFASAQALPKMRVKIDDASVDLSPVYLNVDTYTVPFAKAVQLVFNGKATLTLNGQTATIAYNGKQLLDIPVLPDGPVEVQVYDTDGTVARTISIDDPPRVEKVSGQDRLMIPIDSLSGILGVANDVEDDEVDFFTPAYFSRKLGISPGPDLLAHNIAILPEVGVTPPAQTLLISARGRAEGFAQLYKFESNQPVAMLGKDQSGKTVVDPNFDAGDEPRSERCGPSALAVAETMHTGQLPKYAYYAGIWTKKPFDGSDPLDAIKQGKLGDGDWGVAGARQRITASPILFMPYQVKGGDTIENIAEARKLSTSLIRELNGMHSNEQPPVGRKLMLIANFDGKALEREMNPQYRVTGLHEVQPGDTVASLTSKWKIPAKLFYEANPDVTPGGELDPGDLISVVAMNAAPPPPAGTVVAAEEVVNGRGLTKGAVPMHKTSDPSSPTLATIADGSAVVIAARLPNQQSYRITYRDQTGYVPISAIRLPVPLVTQTIAYVKGKPYSGNPSKWADEATKYLGTPYKWGASNLRVGIDCSHFVEAIYKRLGEPVPEPPVHNMEKFGQLVGFKSGPCEVGGTPKNFATSLPFERLQPGDRIIMQNRPDGPNHSDHHTGLYLGSITLPTGRHIEHAMIDACGSTGVTIHDLATRYWNIYKYALHGSEGRWATVLVARVSSPANPRHGKTGRIGSRRRGERR